MTTRRASLPSPVRWSCVLAAAALVAGLVAGRAPAGPTPDAASVGRPWPEVVDLLGRTLPSSRRLLLGSRDPNGPSCVANRPQFGLLMHDAGGPGTRMAYEWMLSLPQRSSPLADFEWHQTRFRSFAERLRTDNRKVYPLAVRLAEEAAGLAGGLDEASAWPADLKPMDVPSADHRLGRCAWDLDRAIADRRLPEARLAARELASAAFALADLHRWLDLVTGIFLRQLEFQGRCRHVYATCNDAFTQEPYRPQPDISGFPAGLAWVTLGHNLTEVEHQAEWLFRSAADGPAAGAAAPPAAADPVAQAPAAVWVPPRLRPVFVRLRERLEPAARHAWDQAARAPFHHSYLTSVLHHVDRHDGEARVGLVLARYQAAHPQVTVDGLMDVVFHRGGDPDGGEVWDDRFQPHLMAAGATLAGTNRQVLLGAQHFTRAAFGGWDHYRKAETLRIALAEQRFDCINATDMIGALYRNAGRAGFYSIHLAAGVTSHSLAAARLQQNGGTVILAVDGLDTAQVAGARWPDAFFQGGVGWPAGYPRVKRPFQTAELYGRGLDNYIFLEGYILRGPRAGAFERALVPYLAGHPTPEPERLRRAVSRSRRASPDG